jgi:hypothetical protein
MVIGGPRCGIHVAIVNRKGPNKTRRDELKFIHIKNMADIQTRYLPLLMTDDLPDDYYARIRRDRAAERRTEEYRHQGEIFRLENIIDEETRDNGGLDADQPAIERYNAQLRARQRHRLINQAVGQQGRRFVINEALEEAAQQVPPLAGELAQVANDRQNVHTAIVVAKVKETVQTVLKIPVPPEYETDTLKTPGEIILECNLSKQGAWQMMAKYCNDADIYEMGIGIYARVLNSVWQYIKSSPDSADLKKILKSEMEDNIGMCAQGNLSRICNILSGYLDGINADVKSLNQIIGERFVTLISIDDLDERVAAGNAVLDELHVPHAQRMVWLEPLIDA